MRDELAKNVRMFLEEKGIDPVYVVTIFCILIILSYWKDFRHWDKTPNWKKGIIKSTVFGTVITLIASILRLMGLF